MTEINLWPSECLTLDERELKFKQNTIVEDNVTKIIKVSNPSIEVFEPEGSINNGIGIVICPGGGYQILAIDLEGYEIAKWLNKLGYTAFVLKYSVPNEQKSALKDLQRAIQLIRSNSINLINKPKKIGVIGFSAGGNLCVRASAILNEKSADILESFDKISSQPDFALLIYPAYLDEGEGRSLTSEIFINNNTPPMFIFGTSDDVYGNSSLVMTQALRNAKIPVELHFLVKGGHGYGLRQGNTAAEVWPILAESWLKNNIINNNLK